MLTATLAALLTVPADFIFWIGIALAIFSGFWFLFAAYACDVSLARWMLLFPPLAFVFVFRYPETCVKPFLFCVLAVVLIVVSGFFSVVDAVNHLDLPAN